jgi:hypothetical protein
VNEDLWVPYGYGDTWWTLGELEEWLLEHHHPEYVRRLVAWLDHKNGVIGVGGGWRADGSQPGDPGFAPEGKSFHQNQRYDDGFIGACAVDIVKANPAGGNHIGVAWSDVPQQESADAATWGIHANVNAGPTPEAWHIQPVEIDGWDSWNDHGCPAPSPNYPLPGEQEDDDVTDDDIEAIAAAVWRYMLTDPTVNKNITAGDLLEYTRGAASNADRQTRDDDARNVTAEEVWSYHYRTLTE